MNDEQRRKIEKYFRFKAMGKEKFVYKHGVYKIGVGLWIISILIYAGIYIFNVGKISLDMILVPIIILPLYIILGLIYGGYKWTRITKKIEI